MAQKIKIDKTCFRKGTGCRGGKTYYYSRDLSELVSISLHRGIWLCTHHWKELQDEYRSRLQETNKTTAGGA